MALQDRLSPSGPFAADFPTSSTLSFAQSITAPSGPGAEEYDCPATGEVDSAAVDFALPPPAAFQAISVGDGLRILGAPGDPSYRASLVLAQALQVTGGGPATGSPIVAQVIYSPDNGATWVLIVETTVIVGALGVARFDSDVDIPPGVAIACRAKVPVDFVANGNAFALYWSLEVAPQF